jgi:hypothetical protein
MVGGSEEQEEVWSQKKNHNMKDVTCPGIEGIRKQTFSD